MPRLILAFTIHCMTALSSFHRSFLAVCTSLLFHATCGSAPVDIGGIKVAESLSIYNNTLLLNGAGLIANGKTPSYVAQIYAKQKFNSLDELCALPGPKRLVLTAIKEVDTAPIVKMFNRSVDDTAGRTDRAKLIPGLMGIGEVFKANRTLKAGEVMTVDWVPITGMVIYVGGKLQGQPYREPELFKAAMGVWMGLAPADDKVKDALLGKL